MTTTHQNQMRLLAILCLLFTLYLTMSGQCDRKVMVDDYETYWLGTQILSSNLGWDGDPTDCLAGNISVDARQKTLDRINYYRRLAKLPTEVGFEDSLTYMCQQAALMMHSNNQLSHEPPETWSCFSSDGKFAASKSNLALGAHSVNAIALYMVDPGANNGAVGHRRWILYSRAQDFGMGSTNRAQALYVINNKIPAPEGLEYIAYPSPGYFPAPLLPERWSLSVPGGKFDNVLVTLTDESGISLDLSILPTKNGYGDNTLVWEVSSNEINRFSEYDQTITAKVDNIHIQNRDTSITYMVTIAPVTYPPTCQEGTWSESDCACQAEQTTGRKNFSNIEDIHLMPNPADRYLNIELPKEWLGKITHLAITDLMGRTVLKQDLIDQDEINLEEIPTGFYSAQLMQGTMRLQAKLFVRH